MYFAYFAVIAAPDLFDSIFLPLVPFWGAVPRIRLRFAFTFLTQNALTSSSRTMNQPTVRLLLALAFILGSNVRAQDIFQDLATTAFGDMAEIKRKAEAGDARAQHELANSLAARARSADALQWYSKAARQGDQEAFYKVGRMLLYGAAGAPAGQTVAPNPQEGIRLVFRAATNRYTAAYHDMYSAYKDGRGVAKDIIQAYAWLQLQVDTSGGLLPSQARAELNNLALDVDVATSQAGKRMAALYKSGKWPELVVQAPPEPKPPAVAARPKPAPKAPPKPAPVLRLTGIAMGQTPTAVINGKPFAVGETATISAKPQNCVVKCLKIEKDTVLVSLDGEPTPRELRLK